MKTSIVSTSAPIVLQTYTHPETGIVINEEFRDVVGYSGLYQISNLGRVISNKRSKEILLQPFKVGKGYLQVILVDHTGRRNFYVHRIMCEAFHANPNYHTDVNHKDGVKTNNNILNCEWMSHSDNMKHAHRTGLLVSPSGKNHYITDQSVYTFYNKRTNEYFTGLRLDLRKKYNLSKSNLGSMIQGKTSHANGWVLLNKRTTPQVQHIQTAQTLKVA